MDFRGPTSKGREKGREGRARDGRGPTSQATGEGRERGESSFLALKGMDAPVQDVL